MCFVRVDLDIFGDINKSELQNIFVATFLLLNTQSTDKQFIAKSFLMIIVLLLIRILC